MKLDFKPALSLTPKMQYAIIANPASGTLDAGQKRSALSRPAQILRAEIWGLDTKTAMDLAQCARQVASRCDVLVIAGGDGTLSDVINSLETSHTTLAYLPLGTGNSMRYALNYKGSLADMAFRIKMGRIRHYDLIDCGKGKRAFTVSLGMEGVAVRLRNRYLARGGSGLSAYIRAALNAYFREYKRVAGTITLDNAISKIERVLTLMVVKHPYYGFGMKVVPRARFDDHQLHTLCIDSGLLMSAFGAATAFTIGNRIGTYRTAQKMAVHLDRPLISHIDGNEAWESDTFSFKVLPKALKIMC